MAEDTNWNDLKFFMAVAKEGTASRAAKALKVNHTTVLRRVASLEKRLGTRLFDKTPDGFRVTAAGEQVMEKAELIADQIAAIESSVAGQDMRLSGTVRISTSEALVVSPFLPIIGLIVRRHPQIELEIVTSDLISDILRGEADIAIRWTNAPHQSLVGRRLATPAYHLYERFDGTFGAKTADTPCLVYFNQPEEEQLINTPWFKERFPRARVACSVNSTATMHDAARAGIGLARLPCLMGDTDPLLRRHRHSVAETGFDLWLLTHPQLRQTARVRAVLDIIWEHFQRWKGVIQGDEPEAWVKFPELSKDRQPAGTQT